MSAPFSCCWAIAAWQPQPVTCGSPPARYALRPVRLTCYLDLSRQSPNPPRLSTSERRAHGSPEVGSGGYLPPLRGSLSTGGWRVDVHGAAARHESRPGLSGVGSLGTDTG